MADRKRDADDRPVDLGDPSDEGRLRLDEPAPGCFGDGVGDLAAIEIAIAGPKLSPFGPILRRDLSDPHQADRLSALVGFAFAAAGEKPRRSARESLAISRPKDPAELRASVVIRALRPGVAHLAQAKLAPVEMPQAWL
jgi:hypothetical protein